MLTKDIFFDLVYGWILVAVAVFILLFFFKAPYGRYSVRSWGAMMNNKIGWIVMELPALGVFTFFVLFGGVSLSIPVWIFFGFWLIHYVNRSIIYPLRTKTFNKQIPLAVVFMAVFFNTMNGFTNGWYFSHIQPDYDISWLYDPRFIIGTSMFLFGMIINQMADTDLIRLRKPGETGYKIPNTRRFKYISCPNHGGEMLEWAGFAVLTWSLPALAFAIWTIANVLPRSLSHHKWYKSYFKDYPKDRKAVIPFIL
jgi:3-oxo-5-alpha-steroid 4-dehydrogenase 1